MTSGFGQYIAEYTAANFWHYPIRCCITFENALEFMMTSQRNCLTKIIHTRNHTVFFYFILFVPWKYKRYTHFQGRQLSKVFWRLWNGVYSKEGICSFREQILPFRVDLFSEGTWCVGKQARSYKSCLPCKDRQKMYELLIGSLISSLIYLVSTWRIEHVVPIIITFGPLLMKYENDNYKMIFIFIEYNVACHSEMQFYSLVNPLGSWWAGQFT